MDRLGSPRHALVTLLRATHDPHSDSLSVLRHNVPMMLMPLPLHTHTHTRSAAPGGGQRPRGVRPGTAQVQRRPRRQQLWQHATALGSPEQGRRGQTRWRCTTTSTNGAQHGTALSPARPQTGLNTALPSPPLVPKRGSTWRCPLPRSSSNGAQHGAALSPSRPHSRRRMSSRPSSKAARTSMSLRPTRSVRPTPPCKPCP